MAYESERVKKIKEESGFRRVEGAQGLPAYAERIRTVREAMGLTQNEMSKRLGISRVSLTHYEAGNRTPDVEFLISLHRETGASLYYLLGLSECRDDALATTQKDTGLSEKALKHFAADPWSAKVINFLVDCAALGVIADRAAILHDDVRWAQRNPPQEWSKVLQKMRDEHFQYRRNELEGCLEAMLTEVNLNDDLFGVPVDELPTFAAVSMLRQVREIRDGLQLLAEHDPESKMLADQYTRTINAMLDIKEAPDAQETPEQ